MTFIVTLASADLKQTREERVESPSPETAMTLPWSAEPLVVAELDDGVK